MTPRKSPGTANMILDIFSNGGLDLKIRLMLLIQKVWDDKDPENVKMPTL